MKENLKALAQYLLAFIALVGFVNSPQIMDSLLTLAGYNPPALLSAFVGLSAMAGLVFLFIAVTEK